MMRKPVAQIGPTSTAVYGDGGTTQATVIQNLDNASDGTNLNVIADSGQFNLYQAFTLNDNFMDTRTEEVYQTTITNNIVAIQGSLMGWVNKKDMVLGFPISLGAVNTTLTATQFPCMGFDNLGDWTQPELTLLNPIIRVEVRLGNNNQIIQRSQMNYAEGLRLIALDNKYNWNERIALAEVGMPYSVGLHDIVGARAQITSGTGAAMFTPFATRGAVSFEAWSAFNNYKYFLEYACANGVQPITEIAMNLGIFNSFFQENAFLPVGLPFRIEIEFNSAATLFGFNGVTLPTNVTTGTGQADSSQWWGTYNPAGGTNFVLRYRSHILKQHIQDQINNAWLTQPFLYQYDTYEFVEVPMDGTSTTYVKDVAISQQRPTELFFRVLNINTAPVQPGGSAFATYFPNATCPGVTLNNVFVYIGGRQNYYIRATPYNNQDMPHGSSFLANEITNARTYQEGKADALVPSKGASSTLSSLFYVSINPGDFQKRGYISTDQGALVVRVQFTVGNCAYVGGASGTAPNTQAPALSNQFKMVIYKKYPEQIQIDAQKNVTLIQWPVIIKHFLNILKYF